jgi:hypothetical protein
MYDKEKRRQRYLKHRDRELARRKRYYWENKDKENEYSRRYFQEHKEELIPKMIERRRRKKTVSS